MKPALILPLALLAALGLAIGGLALFHTLLARVGGLQVGWLYTVGLLFGTVLPSRFIAGFAKAIAENTGFEGTSTPAVVDFVLGLVLWIGFLSWGAGIGLVPAAIIAGVMSLAGGAVSLVVYKVLAG